MLRTMHLFAGAGGGLLADLVIGHRPVCAVEWEPKRCAMLRAQAAAGWFPGLHVHEGDIRLFDPSDWKGRVDCLHAGIPCQDVSLAGAGVGLAGERTGLWSEVRRCLNVLRPPFAFLECGPRIVALGLDRILCDVAALWYDARWIRLGAGDVGANHERQRWWCLLRRNADGWRWSVRAADTDQVPVRLQGRSPGETQGEAWARDRDALGMGALAALVDADQEGQLQPQGRLADQRGRAGDPSWWGAEPDVGRVAYGVAHGMDRLAALGDGQVPLCAATAWRLLGGP